MTAPDSILRDDVATLIAEAYAGTIFDKANESSAVLAAVPAYPVGTKKTNIPVLATKPTAGWVGNVTNTDRKPTSKVVWTNQTIVVEELAVIIPVHEDTLADATENILTKIAGEAGEALGNALDLAVLFGINKPASWASPSFIEAAHNDGQVYNVSPDSGDVQDLYGAHLIAAGDMADNGVLPSDVIARLSLKFKLANMRGSDGHFLLNDGVLSGFNATHWSKNAAWDEDIVSFIFDPSLIRVAVREDIQIKFLDQATIGTGEDAINLAEQDMVALRVKARYGYVLGKTRLPTGNLSNPVAAVGYDLS